MAFTIEIDDAAVQAAFARLTQLVSDMTPVMKKAAGHLADVAEEAFASQTSPDGIPWVDLRSATKRARAKRGHWPGKMLQVTGHLASSITPDYGPDFAQVGSNVRYAAIQQMGGTIHQAARSHIKTRQTLRAHDITIPARPYLGLSAEAREAILDDIQQAINDALGAR